MRFWTGGREVGSNAATSCLPVIRQECSGDARRVSVKVAQLGSSNVLVRTGESRPVGEQIMWENTARHSEGPIYEIS